MSLNSHRPPGLVGKSWSKGERERGRAAKMHHGSCQGGEKINMILNIHYLCLSVWWEVPRGDFNYDEVVMFFLAYRCVIHTVALAISNYTKAKPNNC